ncbi:MAG: 4-hydroxy-tetrahydrodipicolinate reductase [bacterium]
MKYIALNGAGGRMSSIIALKLLGCDDLAVTEAFDSPDSKSAGNDLGLWCGIDKWGVTINPLEEDSDYRFNIIVDFSSPAGTLSALEYAHKNNKKFISGTTALSDDIINKMKQYSSDIPVIYSSNMSTGINQIKLMLEHMSDYIKDKDRDIEIIEYHHNKKKDAPSGTALSLAETISELTGRQVNNDFSVDYPRNSKVRIHSVRAGSFSGIHSIIISSPDETMEIKHTAHSRETFANGVIRAINFISDKENGLYSMTDVLGG